MDDDGDDLDPGTLTAFLANRETKESAARGHPGRDGKATKNSVESEDGPMIKRKSPESKEKQTGVQQSDVEESADYGTIRVIHTTNAVADHMTDTRNTKKRKIDSSQKKQPSKTNSSGGNGEESKKSKTQTVKRGGGSGGGRGGKGAKTARWTKDINKKREEGTIKIEQVQHDE
ncbi:hypothetical protein LTR86_008134 [Recurvomyces mirabilis]|nr:hypothetical protein LTR86_008134 [Recurvomyces mirabilis]